MHRPAPPKRREQAPPTASGSGPGTDRVLLVAVVLSVAGLLLWLAGGVLLVIFAGVLFAIGLDGLASPLARFTGIPRKLAVVIVSLALLAAGAGLAVLIVPRVVGQIDQIQDLFVSIFNAAQARLDSWGWPEELMTADEVEQERIFDLAGGLLGQMATMTMGAAGVVGTLFVVIFLAFFVSYDPALYRRGLLALLPDHRGRVGDALGHVGHALRWWFLGQLVSMTVLAVTVSAGLWLLGVDLWLSLGVLTGLLTFIPILGPVIAGIPIVIVAFADSASTGLSVLAFYLVVQNVEGNLLVPFVQQRAVHMPPALLISAQILLGTLFGLFGFILAAPLAVVGFVLVQQLYTRPAEEDG